jgi:hypothetical protein
MILATAIGEESFTDLNGSGYYVSPDPFQNLGEPFLDVGETGAYVSGDPFYNFYNASAWEGPANPPAFKGIVCTGDTAESTCTSTPLGIGAQQLVIMSGSYAKITPSVSEVTGSGSFSFTVTDENGNPMAAGTQISASVSPASLGTLSGIGTSFTTACGCFGGPSTYCPTSSITSYVTTLGLNFVATGKAGSTGSITISAQTPGTKISTVYSLAVVL